MLNKLQQMYKDVKALHHEVYQQSVHVYTETTPVSSSKPDGCKLVDQVDTAYALAKMEDLLDDLRKELKKVRKKIETRAYLVFQIEGAANLKTKYCSAKPVLKQFASFPHKRDKDPERFDAIMKSMGVPESASVCEAVRPNWEGFSKWYTKLQGEGKPLPDGVSIDETYTEYTLATRKILDPDEE